MHAPPEAEFAATYRVEGLVQGVGFRPHLHRLTRELGLGGWVRNDPRGVTVEVSGNLEQVRAFAEKVASTPPPARVHAVRLLSLRPTPRNARGREFCIQESTTDGEAEAWVPTDLATCPDCLREVRDPTDRRYRYPFTNCTHCGPRYSIILDLPYDRPRTTMRDFPLCESCRIEYETPEDRRFHAQPIACPACGPRLWLTDDSGQSTANGDTALAEAAAAVRAGRILALKGLGGFQLVCDATSATAVSELRRRKGRGAKPFALMVTDVAEARALCRLAAVEEALLCSPENPIVLLERQHGNGALAEGVAPGCPRLGLMLPTTPLHHLLAELCPFPLIATSGNRSEEPLCTDNAEALERLSGIADVFLMHDRPIARPIDDSVACVAAGRPMVLRRARGYAPAPIPVSPALPPILAVGAQWKGAVALGAGTRLVLGQHLGDLSSEPAFAAFREAIATLSQVHHFSAKSIACDAHPDYDSTRYAESAGLPCHKVQHHHAHALACLAEHGKLREPALAVTWDGVGYGTDGTAWGGEFLWIEGARWCRVAHVRPFALLGADAAAQDPRRCGLAVLADAYGGLTALHGEPTVCAWLNRHFKPAELDLFGKLLTHRSGPPTTTSMGRLFDALAALVLDHGPQGFEGQAAMALENAALTSREEVTRYRFEVLPANGTLVVDWRPLVRSVVSDLAAGRCRGAIALSFHLALAHVIREVAGTLNAPLVALTGGCFQNITLLETTVAALKASQVPAVFPGVFPPNDGGIAAGQVIAAAYAQGWSPED